MTTEQLQKLCAKHQINCLREYHLEVVKTIYDGQDLLVVTVPGYGRSVTIFAAALTNEGKPILVIKPTITSINEAMRHLICEGEPIKAASLTEFNMGDHNEMLKKYKEHQIGILYVTPALLKEKSFRKAMEDNEPWLVVVDECHLVMDLGGRLGPDYREVGKFVSSLSHHPTILAMTDTAYPSEELTMCERLGMIEPEGMIFSVYRPNLSIIVEDCSDHALGSKKEHMKHMVDRVGESIEKYGEKGSAIIYAPTPQDVEIIASALDDRFPGQVIVSHSDLPKWKRKENERLFMMNMYYIMVTTSDYGQAIDKINVRLVVHFGLPLSVVDYYQQIGRASKENFEGHAVVIYDKELMKDNKNLIDSAPRKYQKHLKKQQKELERIITGDKCIMQGLLKALGEEHDSCGHCSACRRKRKNNTGSDKK